MPLICPGWQGNAARATAGGTADVALAVGAGALAGAGAGGGGATADAGVVAAKGVAVDEAVGLAVARGVAGGEGEAASVTGETAGLGVGVAVPLLPEPEHPAASNIMNVSRADMDCIMRHRVASPRSGYGVACFRGCDDAPLNRPMSLTIGRLRAQAERSAKGERDALNEYRAAWRIGRRARLVQPKRDPAVSVARFVCRLAVGDPTIATLRSRRGGWCVLDINCCRVAVRLRSDTGRDGEGHDHGQEAKHKTVHQVSPTSARRLGYQRRDALAAVSAA